MISAKKNYRLRVFLFCYLCCLLIILPSASYSKSQGKEYTYGFKLYQYNLGAGDSVADNPIPQAELGSFTATKSEFVYKEVVKNIGVPVNTARLYRAVGYLNVKNPGSYTIIMTSEGSEKYGCVFVNQKLAMNGRNSPFVLTAPVSFSQPGLYEVDMRIYDSIDRDLVVPKSYSYSPSAKFNFLIKVPDKEKPQPAHKVLLLPLK